MKRTALLALLALAACKGGVAKHEASAEATAALQALPKDASMVFGADLKKARGTEVWKTYAPKLLAGAPADLADLKAACGFDPIEHIDAIAASIGPDLEKPLGRAIVARGQFKEDQLATCFTAMATKRGETGTVTKEGKLTTYRSARADAPAGSGDAAYASWLAADRVLFVPPDGDAKAAIDHALANGGADQGATVKDLLAYVDTTSIVWGVGALPQQVRDQMKMMGYVPDGFFVQLDAPKDLALVLGLRYEDAKAAESSAKLFTTALDEAKKSPPPGMKEVMESLEVAHEGRILKVSAKVPTSALEGLAGMAGAMGGGFGL